MVSTSTAATKRSANCTTVKTVQTARTEPMARMAETALTEKMALMVKTARMGPTATTVLLATLPKTPISTDSTFTAATKKSAN